MNKKPKTCGDFQEQEKEEEQSMSMSSRYWSMDILHLILQRLYILDYLGCRQVCPSWRAAVESAIASKHCLPSTQFPMLILYSNDVPHCFVINPNPNPNPNPENDNNFSASASRLSDRINCRLEESNSITWPFARAGPEPPDGTLLSNTCFGSIEGWLIMMQRRLRTPPAIFFLNPVSGARVMLPPQTTIPNPYSFRKVVASSVPTATMQMQEDCFVVGLFSELTSDLAFCKPTDKSWSIIKSPEEETFLDIEIIDGKLYAATHWAWEYIMVFHSFQPVNDGTLSYRHEKLVMLAPKQIDVYDYPYKNLIDGPYLAKDVASKELFVIHRKIIPHEDWRQLSCTKFLVFKLECNVNGFRWVKVYDLGDRVLFLSVLANKLISSSASASQDKTLLERNCIYFAFDPPHQSLARRRDNCGVFSLKTRSTKALTFPDGHAPAIFSSGTVWFTPSPW